VIKPSEVSFVDAAGCIGDSVKAYTALHYLGRLSSGDSGNNTVCSYAPNRLNLMDIVLSSSHRLGFRTRGSGDM